MINEDKIRQVYASDPKKGFKMLMDNFQVPIYNYIRRLVVSHEDAEDVLQEVFIRVYRNLDQFRGESSLSTWIYRIATNESLRLLNTRKDEEAIPAEEVQEELIGKLKASDYIDYENELAVKFQEAIQTPYRTPDNFFEDMQQKVMERTCGGQRRKHRLQIMFSTAIAAAAILAGVLFVPSYLRTEDTPAGTSDMLAIERSSSDPVDKWIHELSDEELEELVNFSENDIFLN